MAEHFTDLAAEIVAELDNEFETNLIEAVKYHPCIYLTDHPDYENIQENKLAWLMVSNTLQKTVIVCMNKWYALLQIFLHHFKLESNNVVPSTAILWPHYKSIKAMRLYFAETYSELIQLKPTLQLPTAVQKETLLSELEINRIQLVALNSTMEERKRAWIKITDKLNAIQPGTNMTVIKWQKYWWNLKKNVGVQRSWVRMKLQAIGTNIDVSKFSDEDVRIMKFCGATPTDTLPCISAHLNSNVEFGSDADKIIRKCKKCNIILNDLLVHDYCEKCRKYSITLCDVCSKFQEVGLFIYKVQNWSLQARSLLPSNCFSYSELSICIMCSDELRKQATLAWKACRICESYNQTLDHLFAASNDHIRKVFRDATNIEFSEADGLPGYICKICKIQMQQFNNFYLRFSRAQVRLRQIHVEKFVGVVTVKPAGKKRPNNSIISTKKVIIKPEEDASKINVTATHQNYTLKPRNDQEVSTTTNIAPVTTQAIYTAPLGSRSGCVYPVYTKPAVMKRICTTQVGSTSGITMSTSTGANVGQQICTASTRATKGNFVKAACAGPASVAQINNNIGATVTNRICASTMTSPATTKGSLVTQQGSASGNPIYTAATKVTRVLQPGSVPMSTNTGATIARRTYTAPTTKRIIHPGPATVTSTQATKGIGALPQGSASVPINTEATKANKPFPPGPEPITQMSASTGTTVAKRIHTSQPAVFTISGNLIDYEMQHDSPAVFCIPRSAPHLKTSNDTKSPTQIIPNATFGTITGNAASTTTEPAIKTEKIDGDYPGEQLQPRRQSFHNGTPSNLESKTDSEISSNASTISVESTNPLSIHKDLTPKRMKLVRLDGSTVVYNPDPSVTGGFTPNVQNKSSSFQNAFASANLQSIQSRKSPKENLALQLGDPLISPKVYPGRKSQACPLPTEEQQRHQQQQQQQQTSGNKRLRKYWGAVDEFQITSATEKTTSNPKSIQERRMTTHNLSPWASEFSPVTESTSAANTSMPSDEIPIDVVVKQENVPNPSMFYPDSFELGNVTLDSDVSSIISKMMKKQETIDDNMKSFEYINPSFLMSYAHDQELSKREEESKIKNQPNEDKNEENSVEDVKFNVKLRTKKLRVKIKRNEGLRQLALRLKKTFHQPVILGITKKSLRQSNVCKDSKF